MHHSGASALREGGRMFDVMTANSELAMNSPPSTRLARGGEGSGAGGSAASAEAAVPAERPPTPDPSPPLRGGEGEKKWRRRGRSTRQCYPSNTASAPLTASALSITVRSSEVACTVMFSAKNLASVT